MSTIVTRSGKGSPLTHTEVDDNFTNLNTDKYEEGSAIGAVTPAAGTFTTLIGGGSSANYGQLTGGATTKAVEFVTLGSDTNIAAVIKSKGTGAIDLAAGSSGVNISNGGTVTAITRTAGGTGYATAPTVAITAPTTAGGVQATATVAVSAGAITTFTITNAGSGYVEQPTVSFSGGGGSGAAAYATVGSGTIVKSIGSTMSFYTPAGEQFRVNDNGATSVNYVQVQGSSANGGVQLRAGGSDTNIPFLQSSKGSSQLSFYTNTFAQEQLRVAHTASAVNYVQVTGAATGSNPTISTQGSDTNAGLTLQSKGTFGFTFRNSSNGTVASITHGGSSTPNYVQLAATVSGSSPSLNAAGGDTNIDLTLTPKGSGATVANGDFKMNSGYGSAATAYGCRAWVNFNGTGTVAIRASRNVSSITDNATGDYTVNFTTAMPDDNYSALGSKNNNSPNASSEIRLITLVAASARINTICAASPFVYDEPLICLSFFR